MPPRCCVYVALCLLAAALAVSASAADEECQLPVSQDETVLESLPWYNLGRITTFGGLAIGTDYRGRAARSYLKWDLSSLDTGEPVAAAKLRVFLNHKTYPGDRPIEARLCQDDTWEALTITWNTAPAPAAGAAAVVGPPLNAGEYYEWDVTALVKTELAGDKKLSVVLMETADGSNTATFKYFAEQEFNGSTTEPLLLVTQSAGAVDTTPPTLSVTCSHETLWPANHKYVTVEVTINAEDETDEDPTVELVSVESSEPDDANGGGDGSTVNDVVVLDDTTFELRAERSGSGDGRTYTLTYSATDASGNETEATCTVFVPHDMGEKNGKK